MDFVEIETAVSGARDCEVSIVNGIKRAAKQRNAAGWVPSCSAALRLRGGQSRSWDTLQLFSHERQERDSHRVTKTQRPEKRTEENTPEIERRSDS